MAYDTLKAEIRQYIKTNGANEITGQILQNVLLDMVNAYPSLDGYATQQWVQQQGYLTSAELSGYATKIWVEDHGYVTSVELSSYATHTWVQSQLNGYLPLTGGTLTGGLNISDGSHGYAQLFVDEDGLNIMTGSLTGTQQLYTGRIYSDGTIEATGSITGFSFIKAGGTSSQFLKADGSVDSTSYLPLTGGTITGNLGVNGYLTFGSNLLYSGNSDFYIGRNNSGAVNTGNARLRLGANIAELYSGLSNNFFGLDSGGNFWCRLYDALIIQDQNQNSKNILLYSYDEYNGALRTDCDFISGGSVTGSSFIKTGGTSAQFLKTDGSVDSNTYLTTAILNGYATETWVGNNYLPLTGGTIQGNLTIDGGNSLVLNGSPNLGSSHIFVNNDGFVLSSNLATTNQIFLNSAYVYVNVDMEIDDDLFVNNDARVSNKLFVGSTSESACSLNVRYDAQIWNSGSNPYLMFHIPNTNWSRIEMDTNGDFHFQSAQTGTSYKALYASAFNQPSDIRKKNILGDVLLDLNSIANAPLFKFTWKDGKDENVHIGTSAQYWQGLMPELVSENKNGVLGMQYDVAAMAGVTTVAKVVVDHEDRISAIERKLNIN